MPAASLVTLLLLLLPQSLPSGGPAAARAALDETIARHGPESRATASAWRALGRARVAAGDHAGAVEAFEQQLAIGEKRQELASELVDLLVCRIELGNALRAADRTQEAIDVLSTSRQLLERVEKQTMTDARRATLRLGWLTAYAQALIIAGDTNGAIPLLEEALAVARRGIGDAAPNTQVVRQSLAAAFAQTGQLERARELAAEALGFAEANGGPDDRKTAHAQHVLGTFLTMAGRTDEAQPLLERALRTREKLLGPTHGDTLGTLHSLAQVRISNHDPAARSTMESLLEQMRLAIGGENTSTLHVECELAELLTALGDPQAALPLVTHSLAGRIAVFGPRHRSVVSTLLTRARVHDALDETEAAIADLERASELDDGVDPDMRRHLRARLAAFLPAVGREKEALVHARASMRTFPKLMAMALPALLDNERVAFAKRHHQALDQILSWSFSDDEVKEAHRDAIGWKVQVARGLLAQRAWLRRNLDAPTCSRLDELAGVLGALATASQSGDWAALDRLGGQKKRIEQSLPARADGSEQPIDVAALYARLAPDDVLVDFYVYERSDRRGAIGQHLVAFVVDGAKRRPARVDLGPLEPIADAVAAHLRLAARRTRALDPKGAAAADAVAARVRDVLWRPLAKHVAGASRVLVCADGPVALLPFATLPDGEPGHFLLERLEVRSLVSPLDLLPRPAEGGGAKRAIVLGDVDYGPAPAAKGFPPLPGAAEELAAIAAVLVAHAHEIVTLRGTDASAKGLAGAVAGARIVHLATHGECRAGARADTLPGECSGLALAGANERGLFTADEAAWLDLRSSELVVLSACETAQGQPAAGEHVLGLRRALRLAGARVTVTSAWRVHDAATRALMSDFYRRMLDGAEPGRALREAQLALLADCRKRTGDPSPGLWGAFILEG